MPQDTPYDVITLPLQQVEEKKRLIRKYQGIKYMRTNQKTKTVSFYGLFSPWSLLQFIANLS